MNTVTWLMRTPRFEDCRVLFEEIDARAAAEQARVPVDDAGPPVSLLERAFTRYSQERHEHGTSSPPTPVTEPMPEHAL